MKEDMRLAEREETLRNAMKKGKIWLNRMPHKRSLLNWNTANGLSCRKLF